MNKQNETRYCICCAVKMESVFDADPDGSMGIVCARCSAESEHDYDVEPDAEFNRAGRMVDEKCIKGQLKRLRDLEAMIYHIDGYLLMAVGSDSFAYSEFLEIRKTFLGE